jgi:glycosyltransferase involved in cell wall biosynthesis
MVILINASHIRVGGMLQVALSLLHEFSHYKNHFFHVVISPEIELQINAGVFPKNFKFYPFAEFYKSGNKIKRVWLRRKSIKYLSKIEKDVSPDIVFSVYAPTYWRPGAPHIAGFAIPHYVYADSPFFKFFPQHKLLKYIIFGKLRLRLMYRNTDFLTSQTTDVCERLSSVLHIHPERVFHVSNTISEVYNNEELWTKKVSLPPKSPNELRILIVSANFPHKNLKIIDQVIKELKISAPDVKINFLVSLPSGAFPVSESNQTNITWLGRLDVNDCPMAYKQSDFVMLPSLLEVFTAVYPEAMKMRKPILTSDLSFARNICGDAALFFNPLDPADIASRIILLFRNKNLQQELIEKGTKQLESFGTAAERAKLYLSLMEKASQLSVPTYKGLKGKPVFNQL